jgi:hypothetical protein
MRATTMSDSEIANWELGIDGGVNTHSYSLFSHPPTTTNELGHEP